MKKVILAALALALVATSSFANSITKEKIWYDEEGNVAYVEKITTHIPESDETQYEKEKESVLDNNGRSLKIEYVKKSRSGNYLLVGFSASHKGWITCKALGNNRVLDITTHYNDAAANEFSLDAPQATSASCAYKS